MKFQPPENLSTPTNPCSHHQCHSLLTMHQTLSNTQPAQIPCMQTQIMGDTLLRKVSTVPNINKHTSRCPTCLCKVKIVNINVFISEIIIFKIIINLGHFTDYNNMPGFAMPNISDPMAAAAFQYGQVLMGQGTQAVGREFEKYVPVSRLKYYFAVDTGYVVKKLRLLMFPFWHPVRRP